MQATKSFKRAVSNFLRACRSGVGYVLTDDRGCPSWAGGALIGMYANAHGKLTREQRERIADLAQKLGPLDWMVEWNLYRKEPAPRRFDMDAIRRQHGT